MHPFLRVEGLDLERTAFRRDVRGARPPAHELLHQAVKTEERGLEVISEMKALGILAKDYA